MLSDLIGEINVINLEKEYELKPGDTEKFVLSRKKMIKEQIVARGVKDPAVLKAIAETPRHRFVLENLEPSAYDDTPLPIGENQTISQPFIVAYMTEALELRGDERVLEVGTGSGYQTAILSEIVSEVYSVEINEDLVIQAALRFKRMGLTNIRLRYYDGYKGWAEEAPFDRIIVTAAPDHIPQSLIDQLKIGGKMVIPVGDGDQELILVTKINKENYSKDVRIPVRFVPMLREEERKN